MRCTLMTVLILCMAFCAAFAQEKKPAIAFYLTGVKLDDAVYRPFSGFMTMAIVSGGKYTAVDRTPQVRKMIEAEQVYQRAGAVDDEQISALGREWKARYVFDIKVSQKGERYLLAATIVDVDNGNIVKKDMLDSRLKSDNDIRAAAQEIAGWLEISGAFHSVVGPGGMEMVFVKGGTFTMGCTKEQEKCDAKREAPAFSAALDDFYIGKFVVTQIQWRLMMGGDDNPSPLVGDDLPVTNFTWAKMMDFIERVNLFSGGSMTYRLPTEAEWEYAARGGGASKGYIYAGGNDLDEVAWHGKNKDSRGRGLNPVGLKKPNEIGLYDMTGNVCEWVSDWYAPYTAAPKANPQGPPQGEGRVQRGGNSMQRDYNCRIPVRTYDMGRIDERKGSGSLGFRLVMTENKY